MREKNLWIVVRCYIVSKIKLFMSTMRETRWCMRPWPSPVHWQRTIEDPIGDTVGRRSIRARPGAPSTRPPRWWPLPTRWRRRVTSRRKKRFRVERRLQSSRPLRAHGHLSSSRSHSVQLAYDTYLYTVVYSHRNKSEISFYFGPGRTLCLFLPRRIAVKLKVRLINGVQE